MPHIQGHERGELVNRAAEDAVRVLPGQDPVGNANVVNLANAVPPQADPFPTLQRLIGINDARVGDMPAAETELNLRERYGEGGSIDRRLEGLDVNIAGLREIGTTEGEIAAREVALQRLRGGGLGAGALRGQLAAAQEAALRQQSEQFAQRGLGGGVPAVAMMQAQRMGAIGAAGTEAAFRENLQRSALQDIMQMNQDIGQRRLAAQDLLQNYLGSWELPPVDLSALAVVPENRLASVTLPGGGAWVDDVWHPAAQLDREAF